jgi:hypothetical protein
VLSRINIGYIPLEWSELGGVGQHSLSKPHLPRQPYHSIPTCDIEYNISTTQSTTTKSNKTNLSPSIEFKTKLTNFFIKKINQLITSNNDVSTPFN